jgi:hypothetical protein
MINFNTMSENPENPENAEEADRVDFLMKIVADTNPVDVFADPTRYFTGAEKYVSNTLADFLGVFQKVERASAHFTTDSAGDACEHITRQHVRNIMAAYGPHLKELPTYTFTLTFGNEFHRILRKVAKTMESWK